LKRKVQQLTNLVVTISLFSGRPNPQWNLTKQQADVWIQYWNKADLSEYAVPLASKLGYSGCRVQKNKHSYWVIFNSCVSFYDNDTVISKSDPGREMEFFLLHTASSETKKLLAEMKVIG
jgi:hypothetical protein